MSDYDHHIQRVTAEHAARTDADLVEHPLWSLHKKGHAVEARRRMTPGGPELRIVIDGDLWWSRVCPTAAAVQAAADTKHAEFLAKGWA